LIHRGRSTAMIKRSPSIAGLGLCKGWTSSATEAFESAVDKLGTIFYLGFVLVRGWW
jgi:hypothetical protein